MTAIYHIIETEYLLFFAAIPILGLLTRNITFKQLKFPLIIGSALFIIPLFFGYVFLYPVVHYLFIFILLSFLYGRIRQDGLSKGVQLFINGLLSLFLFLIFGFISFLDAFSGSTRIEKTYQKMDFEVRYLKSQGFAGSHHLKIYELRHSFWGGIYSKKLHAKAISSADTNNICVFPYNEYGVSFDRCKEEIILTP